MGCTVVRAPGCAIASPTISCYEFDMHRTRPELVVSLRFELFYALASLFDPTARVHRSWRERAKRALPRSVRRDARVFGPARELWIALAAALPHDEPLDDGNAVCAALDAAEAREIAAKALRGLLHARELVDEMLRVASASRAIAKAPRAERDWLRTLGLVPYRRAAPLAVAIEALVRDPADAIARMKRLVRAFWERCFAPTFENARAQYASVAHGLEEYWRATSFADLCASSLLRVRLNGDFLEAVEGGYRVRLRDVERIVVLPSAFNERRYWSAVDGERGAIVYLPCFEPSIALDGPSERVVDVRPQLRALADESRWAIVQALLRSPRPATDLASLLGLSKATVSHHVSALSRAHLVVRAPRRGTVLLSVDRDAIARLGERILSRAQGGG
jgi:DNA-binding transcriptional ArsR family regulator